MRQYTTSSESLNGYLYQIYLDLNQSLSSLSFLVSNTTIHHREIIENDWLTRIIKVIYANISKAKLERLVLVFSIMPLNRPDISKRLILSGKNHMGVSRSLKDILV